MLTHLDLAGANHFGPIIADEPFLVEDEISYLGQPMVVIAAETERRRRRSTTGKNRL